MISMAYHHQNDPGAMDHKEIQLQEHKKSPSHGMTPMEKGLLSLYRVDPKLIGDQNDRSDQSLFSTLVTS